MSSTVDSASVPPLQKQRLLLFGSAALLGCVAYGQSPSAAGWLMAALAGIAVAVWHGAYDEVLAEQVLPLRFGAQWRLPFYMTYIALAAAMLMVWWWAPTLALPAFLLYSAVHFGTEAEQARSPIHLLSATAAGFLPISAACHWWPAQVGAIFAILLRGDAGFAQLLTGWAGAVLPLVVAIALVNAFSSLPRLAFLVALLTAELALFRFCPPLLAFAIFFCAWHTPEHLVETSRNSGGSFSAPIAARNLKRGTVPWLVSVVAIACVAFFGRHRVEAYAGVVFLALSALTVPHMVLGLVHRRLCATTFTPSPGLKVSRSMPCL